METLRVSFFGSAQLNNYTDNQYCIMVEVTILKPSSILHYKFASKTEGVMQADIQFTAQDVLFEIFHKTRFINEACNSLQNLTNNLENLLQTSFQCVDIKVCPKSVCKARKVILPTDSTAKVTKWSSNNIESPWNFFAVHCLCPKSVHFSEEIVTAFRNRLAIMAKESKNNFHEASQEKINSNDDKNSCELVISTLKTASVCCSSYDEIVISTFHFACDVSMPIEKASAPLFTVSSQFSNLYQQKNFTGTGGVASRFGCQATISTEYHGNASLLQDSEQSTNNFMSDDKNEYNIQCHEGSELTIIPEGLSLAKDQSQLLAAVLGVKNNFDVANTPTGKVVKDSLRETIPLLQLPAPDTDGKLLGSGTPLMIIPEGLSLTEDKIQQNVAALPSEDVKDKFDATIGLKKKFVKDSPQAATPTLPSAPPAGNLFASDRQNFAQGDKEGTVRCNGSPFMITPEGLSLTKDQSQQHSSVLPTMDVKDKLDATSMLLTGNVTKDGPNEFSPLLQSPALPGLVLGMGSAQDDGHKRDNTQHQKTPLKIATEGLPLPKGQSVHHAAALINADLKDAMSHNTGPQLIKTLPEETNQLPRVVLQYNVLYDTNSQDVVPIARDEKSGGGIAKQRDDKGHQTRHKESPRPLQHGNSIAANIAPKPGTQKPVYPKRCCIVAGNKTIALDPNLLAHPHMDTYFEKERTETRPGHFLARLVLHHIYLDK